MQLQFRVGCTKPRSSQTMKIHEIEKISITVLKTEVSTRSNQPWVDLNGLTLDDRVGRLQEKFSGRILASYNLIFLEFIATNHDQSWFLATWKLGKLLQSDRSGRDWIWNSDLQLRLNISWHAFFSILSLLNHRASN